MAELPIYDFVKRYAESGTVRLHMPGHKGRPFLGCEAFDLTEVAGADALYEADGIIRESEEEATRLFGTGCTVYSTEGSSQCIRAMLYLALTLPRSAAGLEGIARGINTDAALGTSAVPRQVAAARPLILAARNVHKAFLYAAALLDFEIRWLMPERTEQNERPLNACATEAEEVQASDSICSCPITAGGLRRALSACPKRPAAVYVTSPDYLGGMADIAGLAAACHAAGTLLLVDNAHGAYLHFLNPSLHPMDLGADFCCDSAHKTLPVLTGGAYLHMSRRFGEAENLRALAKDAMALFGSTSPSYLILCSLDMCNQYLAGQYAQRLAAMATQLEECRKRLRAAGLSVLQTDPLRLVLRGDGFGMARWLRERQLECEYADKDYLVLMLTPENTEEELRRLEDALLLWRKESAKEQADILHRTLHQTRPQTQITGNSAAAAVVHLNMERSAAAPSAVVSSAAEPPAAVLSVREALFRPHEAVAAEEAIGRICASPTVSCPPAVPIVMPGERIDAQAVALLKTYGIRTVHVVAEKREDL